MVLPHSPATACQTFQRGRGLRLTRVRGVPLAGEAFGFGDLRGRHAGGEEGQPNTSETPLRRCIYRN